MPPSLGDLGPSHFLVKRGRGSRSLVGYLRRAPMPGVSRGTEFKSRASLCCAWVWTRVAAPRTRQASSLPEPLTPCALCYISPQNLGGLCAHLVSPWSASIRFCAV